MGGGGVPLFVVVVNEVVPDPVDTGDWVELLNLGPDPADMSGWLMTDSNPANFYYFPAGTILPPGGYVVVEQGLPDSFTFGLGRAGDAVNLYDDLGAPVDSTAWAAGHRLR